MQHRALEREIGPVERAGMVVNQGEDAAGTAAQATQRIHILTVFQQPAGALDGKVEVVIGQVRAQMLNQYERRLTRALRVPSLLRHVNGSLERRSCLVEIAQTR